MKKVIIKPGCISCGACEFYAPDVFEVTDVSRIKKDADIKKNKEKIDKAIQGCPVCVIKWSGDE
ncbi:ferredoxin [bacterium]|nr:ferredoxin [bacterium]